MKLWRIECPTERIGPWGAIRRTTVTGPDPMGSDPVYDHCPSSGPSVRVDCFDGDWDRGGDEMKDRVCACASIDQLRMWFKEWHLAHLEAAGFVLVECEAPDEDCAMGAWQVAVRERAMKRVAEHRPTAALSF